MLGQMQTSGGMLRVGVGVGSEIFTKCLLIPPNIYTDKFLLKVEISAFGVPKERIAKFCHWKPLEKNHFCHNFFRGGGSEKN